MSTYAQDPTAAVYELGLHAGSALTVRVAEEWGLDEGVAATRSHLANALPDVEREILWDAVQRIVKLRTAPEDTSTLPEASEALSGCHRPGCEVCAATLTRARALGRSCARVGTPESANSHEHEDVNGSPRASRVRASRVGDAEGTVPADAHAHADGRRVVSLVVSGDDPRADFREFLNALDEREERAIVEWMLASSHELKAVLVARLVEMDREAA